MRIVLVLLAALAVLEAACSPSSGRSPEAGGQTGDPGVTDFISLDPGTPGPPGGVPGGGGCVGTFSVLGARSPWPHQALKLNETHAVLFDDARGLAIVDLSRPVPRVSGRLFLPRSFGTLHVSGKHAFVSRRNVRFGSGYTQIGDEAELLAVDLSDPTAPRVVARLALEEAPRTSMLVESGGTTRLYVLSMDDGTGPCANPSRALLTSYEWIAEHFEPRATFTLPIEARGGIGVEPVGDMLAVFSQSLGSYTVPRFISLAAADGTMRETGPVTSETVVGMHMDAPGRLRLLTSTSSESHLDVFDLRDPSAPVRLSRCTVDRALSGRASFSPHHVFVASDTSNNFVIETSVTSVTMAAVPNCEVRDFPGRRRSLVFSERLPEGRVFDIDKNERLDVTVRLLDETDLHLLSELTLPALGDPWADDPSGYGRAAVHLLPGEQGALLSLPIGNAVTLIERRQDLQLFRVKADGLTALGPLLPAMRSFELPAPEPIVWTAGKLARVDLTDPDKPRLGDARDVLPNFSHVVAFDSHWARLRSVHDRGAGRELDGVALLAANGTGSIELVPIDQDPDLSDEEARIEANPFGSLIRVGSLLVSMARAFPRSEGLPPKERGPVPTLFEVFDLSDPKHPKRSGALSVEALSLPDPCPLCAASVLDTGDLAVKDALVLRTRTDSGELALRVLDLSDPTKPTLSDVLTRPEQEPMLSAFTDGRQVYYTYRVPEPQSSDGSRRARFYFRRIDLSIPNAPSFGDPVNVPGQLVAIQDGTLYTRELAQEQDMQGMRIHRLALQADKATLAVTHTVGDRSALGIELTPSGHVLVDLRGSLQSLLYGTWTTITPSDLRVLDAETLEQVGEGYIGQGTSRLAVQGEHVLYSAAQGVVLMSLKDPATPRAQAFIPTFGYGAGQGTLAGDSVIIEDYGALKRFGLDTTNLP